jgi:hypothetical protein
MTSMPPLAHRAVVRVAADVTVQVASGVTVDQAADSLLHEMRTALPDLATGLTLHRADATLRTDATITARVVDADWRTYLRRPRRAPHGRTRQAQRRALGLIATAEQAVADAHRAATDIHPPVHGAALDADHEFAVQLAMLTATYMLAVEAWPDGHLQRKILSRAGAAAADQVVRTDPDRASAAFSEAHQRLAAAGYVVPQGGEPA